MFEGEVGKQEIFIKCSENSRFQIVFRTDIFQKLTLGVTLGVPDQGKGNLVRVSREFESSEFE